MITTRACSLLGITHPVVLGGMGSGFTNPDLVAPVPNRPECRPASRSLGGDAAGHGSDYPVND